MKALHNAGRPNPVVMVGNLFVDEGGILMRGRRGLRRLKPLRVLDVTHWLVVLATWVLQDPTAMYARLASLEPTKPRPAVSFDVNVCCNEVIYENGKKLSGNCPNLPGEEICKLLIIQKSLRQQSTR